MTTIIQSEKTQDTVCRPGGVLLGILGMGVLSVSPNLCPIPDQKNTKNVIFHTHLTPGLTKTHTWFQTWPLRKYMNVIIVKISIMLTKRFLKSILN